MCKLPKLYFVTIFLFKTLIGVQLESTVFEPWFMVKHLNPNVTGIELKNGTSTFFKSSFPRDTSASPTAKYTHYTKQNSRELSQVNPPLEIQQGPKNNFQNMLAALGLFMGYRAAQQQSNRIDREHLDDLLTSATSEPNENLGTWFKEFITMAENGQFQFPSLTENTRNQDDMNSHERDRKSDYDNQNNNHNQLKEQNAEVYKTATTFLSANPDIQMYVTSSPFRPNSFVNLTLFKDKIPSHNKAVSRGPMLSNKFYKIFCEDSETLPLKFSSAALKLCQNVIGTGCLPEPSNDPLKWRTKKEVVFDLKEGSDVAIGRLGYSNIFYVNKGHKLYTGQDKMDTFILMESGLTGLIDGGDAHENSLIMTPTFEPERTVIVKLRKDGGQIQQAEGSTLLTRNLQTINGRQGAVETFTIESCTDLKFINGQGGKSRNEQDLIEIVDSNPINVDNKGHINGGYANQECPNSSLNITIYPWTTIKNFALHGNFVYNFYPISSKEFQFYLPGLSKFKERSYASHRIFLNWKFDKISHLVFDKNASTLTLNCSDFDFSLTIPISRSQLNLNDLNILQQPSIYTMKEDSNTIESEIHVDLSGQLHVTYHLDQSSSFSEEIDLKQHKIVGFDEAKNVFNIHNGHWLIQGGKKSDIFNLYNGNFSGHLNGGLSLNNSLVFDKNYQSDVKVIEINLQRKFIAFEDNIGDQSDSRVITIMVENFNRVIGRPNKTELITIDCSTNYVNGMGGLVVDSNQKISPGDLKPSGVKKSPDVIKILPNDDGAEYCPFYKSHVVVHPGTVIQNFAQHGEFNYEIARLGGFDVETNFPSGTTHNYMLPYNFESIRVATFSRQIGRIRFRYHVANSNLFHQSHWLKFSNSDMYHVAPNVMSKDGILFRVRRSDKKVGAVGMFNRKSTNFWSQGFKGINGVEHTLIINDVAAPHKYMNIFGADQDDIFILGSTAERTRKVRGTTFDSTGTTTAGFIDGMGGQNLLEFDSTFLPSHTLNINLLRGKVFAIGPMSTFKSLKIFNISSIQGRPNGNDTIVVNCNTKFVSGLGGHDLVIVPRDISTSCKQNGKMGHGRNIKMEIVIETYPVMTRVINFATQGKFIYQIHGVASFDVETGSTFEDGGRVDHEYQLSFDMDAIEGAWLETKEEGSNEGQIVLKVGKKTVKYSIWVERDIQFGELCNTKPRIVTKDGLCLSVNSQTTRRIVKSS